MDPSSVSGLSAPMLFVTLRPEGVYTSQAHPEPKAVSPASRNQRQSAEIRRRPCSSAIRNQEWDILFDNLDSVDLKSSSELISDCSALIQPIADLMFRM